jgi:hypothetical protein
VPSRCRGHKIRSSTYTTISGDAQQFPLERVECPYSKSGCCSSPPEDDFPNAPTGFLGASAGETPMTDDLSGVSYIALAFLMLTGTLRMLCGRFTHVLLTLYLCFTARAGSVNLVRATGETGYEPPQERQEDAEDAGMWQQEGAADAQQQARGGNSLISPLLSPLALHSSQNTATLVEQRRLDDETEMERKLAAEMHKVRSICTSVLVKRSSGGWMTKQRWSGSWPQRCTRCALFVLLY